MVGLWHPSQTKTTLFWLVFSAIAASFTAAMKEKLSGLFESWLKATLTLLLFEFVATNYTLSFGVELVLVPVLFLLGAMLAIASREEKFRSVRILIEWILLSISAWMFFRGFYLLVTGWNDTDKLGILRDVYTPPLLSLTLIPFAYVMFLYARYESAFVGLKVLIPDPKLRHYAEGMSIIIFGPRTQLLYRWKRALGSEEPSSRADVIKLMTEVLDHHKRERALPEVDPSRGWCPIRAGRFLKAHDLIPGDYHRLDDEYYSCTPLTELNAGLPADNIAYYVEGNKEAATRLKLVLNVNSDYDPECSEITLLTALQTLIKEATGYYPMTLELQKWRKSLSVHDLGIAELTWETVSFNNGGYQLKALLTKKLPSRENRSNR